MENPELSYPSAGPLPGALPVPQTEPAIHTAPTGPDNAFGEQRHGLLQRTRKRIGSIVAAIVAVVAKFFAAIKTGLLLLTKAKLLVTAGTALVSVAAYSLFWGWTFALGFVILLFVHEMGHVLQLRREGLTASTPKFVPFMGAFITAKTFGDNALAEARVGLAGPVLGTLGSGVCLLIAELTNSDFFRALAYIGFFLNLFNLLPIVPLDGGRAMAAMAPWMWFLGFGVLVALDFLSPNFILLIITLLAGLELYRRWEARKSGSIAQAAYYRVSPRNRLLVGAVYLGLIVVLALGMADTHILSSGGHSFSHL
jgi:Zn-dependent protease